MPAYVAGAAVKLIIGGAAAVLNAENLSNAAFAQAVQPQVGNGSEAPLTIINKSGQALALYVSANNAASANYVPFDSGGTAVSVPDATALCVMVTPGLFYALKAGGAITAGSAWMAR